MSNAHLHVAIRETRKQIGMSQRQLAAKMNCQRTYISKIENAMACPNIETLERFSAALGITPWVLLKRGYESAGLVRKRTAQEAL